MYFLGGIAQSNGEPKKSHKFKTVYQKKEFLKQVNVNGGYLSNSFTNPGLMVQLESPYKVRTKKINKYRLIRHTGLNMKDRVKTIRYDFLAGAKTAFRQYKCVTQYQIATYLTKAYPKFKSRLPEERSFHESPIYTAPVFFALALGFTHYFMNE